MKNLGLIFTYSEIDDLNEKGYLNDLQLLDDNGGNPYGNCVIVGYDKFTDEEIEKLELKEKVIDVYYTQNFDDEMSELDFEGKWWAKGCTNEAYFQLESDFNLVSND